MRRGLAINVPLILALTVGPAAGCALLGDRQGEADAIASRIKSLPGVANARAEYKSNFTAGEHFELTSSLSRDATPAQAADVARTFVTAADTAGFESANSAALILEYPAQARRNYDLHTTSSAKIDYTRTSVSTLPEPAQAAARAASWLQAAQSPIAEYVDAGWRDDGASVTVNLRPQSTAEQARALQQAVPGLARAEWVINIIRDERNRPNSYESTPTPPADDIIALWTRLSDAVGPYGHISGSTAPTGKNRPVPTELEAELPDGRGSEPDQLRIPPELAELAKGFGHPVKLTTRGGVGAVQIIVGGCHPRDPKDKPPTALQQSMSAQFEKC